MKILFAFIISACFIATSNATFRLLKSKQKSTTLIRPVVKYKTVQLLTPAVEPLPASYVRPVSTYTTHLSTYSVSPTVIAPAVQPYETTYATVYAHPIVTYGAGPILHYQAPETVYFEPYDEDRFSLYDEYSAKH